MVRRSVMAKSYAVGWSLVDPGQNLERALASTRRNRLEAALRLQGVGRRDPMPWPDRSNE